MSCPRLRFFMRAPSNWLGVGALYVGVAAPLPITEPFNGVPARIALGALVDLSIAKQKDFSFQRTRHLGFTIEIYIIHISERNSKLRSLCELTARSRAINKIYEFLHVNRYVNSDVIHLSSTSEGGFDMVLSTDGCLDPVNRESALG